MERHLMDVACMSSTALPVKPFKELFLQFTWTIHPISITCLTIKSDYILREKMKNPPQIKQRNLESTVC